MSNQVQVTQLKIRIGGREIELTPEEARKLYAALDELVGTKEVVKIYPSYPYPIWINANDIQNPNWTITPDVIATSSFATTQCGGVSLCVNA